MYSIAIDGENFSVEKTDQGIQVNGEPILWDLIPLGKNQLHVIKGHQSLEAELLAFDPKTKTLHIRLGEKRVLLTLKDRFDLLLEKMGMDELAESSLQDIKAPMPGLILELNVQEGDSVKKGDVVLILEAMKMENTIKSPGDGIVSQVHASLGQSVEKNQLLVSF